MWTLPVEWKHAQLLTRKVSTDMTPKNPKTLLCEHKINQVTTGKHLKSETDSRENDKYQTA